MQKRISAIVRYGLAVVGLAVGSSLAPEVQAQHVLRGQVRDAETGQPLPYAHVTLADGASGTATNAEGSFVLRLPSLPADVEVSFVGYAPQRFHVADTLALRVALMPAPLELDELVVRADDAARLVEQAYVKALASQERLRGGQAFYRQLAQAESVYYEVFENFYEAAISGAGIKEWTLEQGRFGLRQDFAEKGYGTFANFSMLTLMATAAQQTSQRKAGALLPLRADAGDHFDFAIVDRMAMGDRTVAKVAFEPTTKKPAPRGHVFIDEETFDVLRYVFTFPEGSGFEPIVMYGKGHRAERQELHFLMTFREALDGEVLPAVIEVDAAYDYVQPDHPRRRIRMRSQLVFFSYHPSPPVGGLAASTKNPSDYSQVNARPYDPAFWANNPVLARTPIEEEVIRSFEEAGAFGNLVGEGEAGAGEPD